MSWDLILLANVIVLVDLVDLLVRLCLRRSQARSGMRGRESPASVSLGAGDSTSSQTDRKLQPYALLVSVHNLGPGVEEFVQAMTPYRSRLWVIDDASTDDTWRRLQLAGVQRVRNERNSHKPGAIKELLTRLPTEIVTVMVLDPDARILDRSSDGGTTELEVVLSGFQQSGMAAMCPRLAIKPAGLLANLQAFEYWMAFSLGRKSLRDQSITSGIAIYRRDALVRALDWHTLSVYAEDLKNALILMTHDERVYYDDRLVVETEGKDSWRSWFSQRVGWSFGLIKVYAEHWRDALREAWRGPMFVTYHYAVYMGLFSLVLHPVKLLSACLLLGSAANGLDNLLGLDWIPDVSATSPVYFVSAYFGYTGIALLGLWVGVAAGQRRRLVSVLPVYFFYGLAHLVPVTIGYLNWFSLKIWRRRLYRDHYQAEVSLRQEQAAGAGSWAGRT